MGQNILLKRSEAKISDTIEILITYSVVTIINNAKYIPYLQKSACEIYHYSIKQYINFCNKISGSRDIKIKVKNKIGIKIESQIINISKIIL